MIQKVEISSVDELLRELNELPNHFLFRGHSDSNWSLEPSLERIIGQSWSVEMAKKIEEFSIEEFTSKFHLYDRENIHPNSKLAWLSIMQHYGVPTRLLDFTTSPYVALYFALESYTPHSNSDIAVYALDYSAIMQKSIDYVSEINEDFQETRYTAHLKKDKIFEKIVDKFSYDVAWVTEPKRLNVRLDRQAGTFLLSGNRDVKLMEILNSGLYHEVDMRKIIINKKFYRGVFALLRKMNITSKSLYGDLDGLALSLKMQMQVYSS